MMKYLLLLSFCGLTGAMELPERAHSQFSWWISVSIENVQHKARIFANGNVELTVNDGIHEPIEKNGNVGKEWAEQTYELAREAAGPLKLDGPSKGGTERILTLDFDLDVGALILSIKESALKHGLYQRCIEQITAAEKQVGLEYAPKGK